MAAGAERHSDWLRGDWCANHRKYYWVKLYWDVSILAWPSYVVLHDRLAIKC